MTQIKHFRSCNLMVLYKYVYYYYYYYYHHYHNYDTKHGAFWYSFRESNSAENNSGLNPYIFLKNLGFCVIVHWFHSIWQSFSSIHNVLALIDHTSTARQYQTLHNTSNQQLQSHVTITANSLSINGCLLARGHYCIIL